MKSLLIAIALALVSCSATNAGWTVVYDFNSGKPVVVYTPDRVPAYQPYNPYVYPTPNPYYPSPCPCNPRPYCPTYPRHLGCR